MTSRRSCATSTYRTSSAGRPRSREALDRLPAHDEVECIDTTVRRLAETLERDGIDHEILVVDDASTDGTVDVLERLATENPRVRWRRSHYPPGFGFAVRAGLDHFEGDAVAIVMADGSDDPADVVHRAARRT